MVKNTEIKKEIRRRMLEKRAAIPPDVRRKAEEEIAELLFSCAVFQEARDVFCYVSVREEVSTRTVIRESLRLGKRVAVPKVLGRHRMEFFYIEEIDELTEGRFGIPEPDGKPERRALPGKTALVVMPGAAFDESGGRLGYGGGYYDAYLGEHPRCRRAALAFSEQITKDIPGESHDVRPEIIVTEKRIIICEKSCQKTP